MSGSRAWSRRRLGVFVLVLGLAGVTACGGPALLDPTDPELAARQERLVEHMTAGLTTAAEELGASAPLAVRTDTWCEQGERGYKESDIYRSTCYITVEAAFAVDAPLAASLVDLDGLQTFEQRLDAAGWGAPSWSVTSNPYGEVSVEHMREYDFPISDVNGVRLWSGWGDGTYINVGVLPGTEDVELEEFPGRPGYYSVREGSDWRPLWNGRSADHAVLITGRADAVLARQPW